MDEATTMAKLRSIKVRDMMRKDVVCLDSQAPISEAIRVFEEYHISGAPVLDSGGTLVGVLTSSDVTRTDHVHEGRLEAERHEYYLANPLEEERDDSAFGDETIFAKADYSSAALGGDRIADWMSPRLISIDPDTSLKVACETMVREAVHRLMVTEESKLLGIVSSFDVVRAIGAPE